MNDNAIDQTTGEVLTLSMLGYEGDTPVKRDELLSEWNNAKQSLDYWKERESKLRAFVVAVFTDPQKDKGTESVELPNDFKLKIVKDINYKFISRDPKIAAKDAVLSAQERIEQLAVEGRAPEFMAAVADQLVKWQPELSISAYTKLPADVIGPVHAIINEYIETKPASPQVSIVPPKESKQ